MKKLKKIKGDASNRKFFRKRDKDSSSVLVFAKKDKIKNLLIYDAINKVLNKNKILAPKLFIEHYHKNFMEIQDFGNSTILKILNKKEVNKFFYFKKIIEILNQIQVIKDRNIKTFRKQNYIIPKYDNQILIREANLFSEWYIKKKLSNKNKIKFIKRFRKILTKLTLALKLKNNTFVHRDFHVSNLMLVNNKIGVIDSQDALIGNKAYDLASLVDDVRFKTSKTFKDKVYKFYINKQKKINKVKFRNDFEILSILRNLKIIGIFTRLAIKDGKKDYLKLIPYAWSLIDMRMNKNNVFNELRDLLKIHFKGKIK
tara:strand:- start:491 stop:1432 length:942 start_codon:yes stop_codon:yes gene_type:complete